MISTREAYSLALLELGKTKPNVVVVDADLSVSTGTHKFAKAFPDRFFDVGCAEQNMVGVAAGLAIAGVGIVLWHERAKRNALPPAGIDIPSREELPELLSVCIAAKLGKVETTAAGRFLSGAMYWKCIDEGMEQARAVEYASAVHDAVLDIRIVE